MPDANQYEDFLFSFESGVNSGVEAVLLLKNQLAWAENATVRGGYITHRPPIKRQTLSFADPAVQSLVNGKLQGAAVYRPDNGQSQIIAQFDGHLLAFTESGNVWNVTDVSIAGDLNDPWVNQVWMWQAEKWLIINDGTGARPIFYDGVTSRRSTGESVVLGTTDTNFTPVAVGAIATLSLTAPWTRGFGETVLFNGEYYKTVGTSVSLNPPNAQLSFVSGVVGPFAIGTEIIVDPNFAGALLAASTMYWVGLTVRLDIVLDAPNPSIGVGTTLIVNHPTTFKKFSAKVITVTSSTEFTTSVDDLFHVYPLLTFPAGSKVTYSQLTPPTSSQGTIQIAAYTASGLAIWDSVVLSAPYAGVDNQTVFLNGNRFLIRKYASPDADIRLENLSDTSTTAVSAGHQILSVPELPPGRMGAYGRNRNWICGLDGMTFVASDLVNSASGSVGEDYRDAVLKMTENTFLAGGGSFKISSSGDIINAMVFSPTLDASFGQGPLQVGTLRTMFSCDADKASWSTTTSPILSESMKGNGPTGQDSTVLANSDILFRTVEGVASMIQGRRGFSEWGNKGISFEMRRLFRSDDRSLLGFGSSVVHDNRFITTANAVIDGINITHQKTAALNFDLISGLTTSAPPVWEGEWNIPRLIKWIQGNFGNTLRTFAFIIDSSDVMYLAELLRYEDQHYDNVSDRIVWAYETAMVFNKDVKPPQEIVNLLNGEIYVKDVHGAVDFVVKYRPDFHPSWIPWTTFSISADPTSLTGYRTPLGFGKPTIDGTAENANNRSFPNGHFFQVRVEITGDCKVTAMRFACSKIPKTPFAPPVANTANPVQLIPSTGQDLPMP